jgi:hypothetical protein
MTYLRYLKDNPVILLDIIKYVVAALVMAGVAINPAIVVPAGAVILTVLTLVTRSRVVEVGKHDAAVEDALNTPTPGPETTGEADYLAALDR